MERYLQYSEENNSQLRFSFPDKLSIKSGSRPLQIYKILTSYAYFLRKILQNVSHKYDETRKEEDWNSGNRGFNIREKTFRMMGEGSSWTTTMQQDLRRNNQPGAEGYKGSRRKENKRTDGSFHAFDYVENCIEWLLQNVGRLTYRNK